MAHRSAGSPRARRSVRFGIDRLVESGCAALRGKRVGAIVNHASVDADFRHLAAVLGAAPGVTLAVLFGPEHGAFGDAQYMVPVADGASAAGAVPIESLYGADAASLSPSAERLGALDVLLFDLQDVGSRYYTYLATMGLAMEAAAKAHVAFWVLDRPNPIGLTAFEGNLVEPGFESFVGRAALPNRHGLTAGEVALLLNERAGAELTVVRCDGLTRGGGWPAGRPFIAPSPNMPTLATALVYPGMCLLEGTNLSEGRGTCQPFEQFGAPYLDAERVARALNAARLPGVHFRPCRFTPTFDKWAGTPCEGAFLHVTDPEAFEPVRTGVHVVAAARELGGASFAWRTDAYEFVADIPAFDLLCGTSAVREALERGASVADATASFQPARRAFEAARARVQLYA